MKKAISYLFIALSTLATSLYGRPGALENTPQRIECKLSPLGLMSKGLKRQYTYKEQGGGSTGIASHVKITHGTSLNWSGYAAFPNVRSRSIGSVSDVIGSWVVPVLSCSSNITYTSIWVGIDGYASSTVEQIGTEHDWANGKQRNYAWFEMYPQSAYEIVGFPVNENDRMGAEVRYVGNHTFQMFIINYTKNVYTIIPSSYTKSRAAQRNSAEWVVEAPSSINGVLPLSHFGTAFHTNCYATINGIKGAINDTHWDYDAITMKTPTGVVKAFPSALSSGGTAFSVAWSHE